MAPDFRSYLVKQIIAEKQTVSYRSVARALKVHANSAKCMLYEFWEKENKKHAGTIYATYLLAGTKSQESKDPSQNGNGIHKDEDQPMPSSPPLTSSMPERLQQSHQPEERDQVPVKTITLVREENLEDIKAQYENITSIHIYSLSPGRLGDLVALTEVTREINENTFAKEDPLTNNKTYGVIQNTGVRRRKGKRPVIPDVPIPKFKPTKDEKPLKAEETHTKPSLTSAKSNSRESSRPGSRDGNTPSTTGKQPNLKRDGSNLFKAFAKAQNKPKLNREETTASTNASASGAEDVKMTDADEEGESEDEALFLDTGTKKPSTRKRAAEVKQERANERAKLQKMMDSDDEQEKAAPRVEEAAGLDEKPADDADEEVAWSDSDTEKQSKASNKPDDPVLSEPKRRRGKRKVMKKRTMKDEDGYLVTKEEAVWESFSEDEPENENEKAKSKTAFSSMKSQPSSQPSSQKSTASTKGGTQTKKKGDIMSFFGKK